MQRLMHCFLSLMHMNFFFEIFFFFFNFFKKSLKLIKLNFVMAHNLRTYFWEEIVMVVALFGCGRLFSIQGYSIYKNALKNSNYSYHT